MSYRWAQQSTFQPLLRSQKTGTSGDFDLFVEVEVSNTTAAPVCVAALQLEPPPSYVASAVSLASLESEASDEESAMFGSKESGAGGVVDPLDVDGVFRARPVLQPSESFHSVFRVTPVAGGDSRVSVSRRKLHPVLVPSFTLKSRCTRVGLPVLPLILVESVCFIACN
jgi:hypothetical protein